MPAPLLPPVVRALLEPTAYTHPVDRVELIQTHISLVFLAGDYAYKIKKPVDFGFVNYSTLARRRYYCRREVELNRRLCRDVYLGVVPIREAEGAVQMNGRRGRIVEYAVQMKRLAEERMMHVMLERGEVTEGMVGLVAEKLASFHQSAETSPGIASYGDRAIRYNCSENVAQWQPYIGRTITAEQDAILQAYLEAFHARKADVMRKRVDELRIKHCHSDLRSDAVCFVCDGLSPECVCIMDCVEFNRRMMLVDAARDVAFLSMDLEFRGHPQLSKSFVKRYTELGDDPDLAEVLPYYACYNACVRGKVESFLLDLPEVPGRQKRAAAKRARRYFELAVKYAESLPSSMLVITCGLSGSGKSTVAAAIAPAMDAEIISSDVTRKRLMGIDPESRIAEEYRAGVYSAEVTKRTYGAMMDAARERLLEGRSVILDATFIRRSDRRAVRRLARECGAQFACLLVTASEDEIKKRMEARERGGRGVSDARWNTYKRQKRRFQKTSEVPEERLLTVETTKGGRADVRAVLKALRNLSPLSLSDLASRGAVSAGAALTPR